MERLQVGQQILDIGGVTEPHPCSNRAELDDAAEDMGEWKEEQGGCALVHEEFRHALDDVVDLEHEVAVGEHAALGATGCTGGVDDGRE